MPLYPPAIDSGTYTPTLTNVTNIAASTAYACQYLRVGSVVTVSGKVDIDPTSSGLTVLGISLPITSNFATAQQCGGTSVCLNTSSGGAPLAGTILADTTNDRAEINLQAPLGSVGNAASSFTFTYLIV